MQVPRRPFYWAEDSLHLFNRASGIYLQLSNNNILSMLKSVCARVLGYEKFLIQYPDAVCAPLDSLYLFRRAACTLDEELVQDYLFCFDWRQANWGAWLAALAPCPTYARYLHDRRPKLPHGTAVTDLALAACQSVPVPASLEEHWALVCKIREWLAQLPASTSPLRRAPTLEEEVRLEAEAHAARVAYRRGGLVEAKIAISQSLLGHYSLEHVTWAKRTRQ